MKKLFTMVCCLLVIVGCNAKDKDETKKKETNTNKVSDATVSFVGVGDNLIHETVYQEADEFAGEASDGLYDFKPMYKEVKKDIEKADVSFINQETILGGQSLGLSGYPMFNSPTEIAENLKDTGFDLVNLASNHSLDKGQTGINEALAAFRNTPELVTNGIYDSMEGYNDIPVIEKNGIKIAFLSYTYGTNGIDPPNEYSVSYFSDDKIASDVAKAKEISDVILVSAHWGDENTFAPNEYQEHYAQALADAGVDVIIGTHPHTIQSVEWKQGINNSKTLVVYSLGNFLGGMLGVDNVLSGMINFDFVRDGKTKAESVENVKWTPLVIHFEGNQSNILEERSKYKVYKLDDYSDELAKKHVLNGYEGQEVSKSYFQNKTEEVISSDFLK